MADVLGKRIGWIGPALEALARRYFGVGGPAQGPTESEWSRATVAALTERLGPALGEAAGNLGLDLPRSSWVMLTAARLENERRSATQERTLIGLSAELEGVGLRPVLFKGLALSRHYPARGVREASDVDILVPAERLRDLDATLRSMGFRGRDPVDAGLAGYALSYVGPPIGGGEDVELDVHPAWHEVSLSGDGGTVRVGSASAAVEPVTLDAGRWAGLPPAVELYLASAHAVLHIPRTLSVYLDLAVLVAAADDDTLRSAWEFSRSNGRQRHFKHALTSAADLFGVTIPSEFLSTPSRLGLPTSLRVGYLGPRRRFMPSALVMELALRRGLKRKLGFARWVLGHGSRGSTPRSSVRAWLSWPVKTVRGLRWFKGALLRYRIPGPQRL